MHNLAEGQSWVKVQLEGVPCCTVASRVSSTLTCSHVRLARQWMRCRLLAALIGIGLKTDHAECDAGAYIIGMIKKEREAASTGAATDGYHRGPER